MPPNLPQKDSDLSSVMKVDLRAVLVLHWKYLAPLIDQAVDEARLTGTLRPLSDGV